ncbi:MAG: hydrolase 2, exosortase A system-associated [Pseudomonadota bacterium]|nr:hydrolase 2, exosortase A system-associated [Pseudomonadota bacterium]
MEPRFVEGAAGRLFQQYFPPDPAAPGRGQVLYIHPFAEEMNKSRRMAALQARRFAAAGYGVLLPDLYGCGDSGGDFADARWETWMDDLRRSVDGMRARHDAPLHLWGLRLGALLAACLARELEAARLILWQPVLTGEQMLTQFLRLRLAASLMQGGQQTVAWLRGQLAAGQTLEVAGYDLHPQLAAALDRARLLPPPAATPVDWLDLVAAADRPPSPASRRLVEAWRAAGVAVNHRTVVGEPFWGTQEISVVPQLLDATAAGLEETFA